MADDQGRTSQLGDALKGLVKLIKALRYYPPGHPALRAAVSGARQGFLPLFEGHPCLAVVVRKEGFVLDDRPVAAENPILQKLAPFLFSRRIQSLSLLPDLSPRDIRTFARCLTLAPEELQRHGGVAEILRQAQVTTVWVNEIDLASILARRMEIEAQKGAAAVGGDEEQDDLLLGVLQSPAARGAAATAEGRSLERVLRELQQARSDQHFRLLLEELAPLVRLNLTDQGRPQVLRALAFLCRNCGTRQGNPLRREQIRQTLGQLATDDVLDFLLAVLCSRDIQKETVEQAQRILVFLGAKVTRRLMDHLAVESDALARRALVEAIVRQSAVATPIVIPYLGDERWYVVRNAVAILGEIRATEAIRHFPPLLGHADFRVRRETIRALARIGGNEAVTTLLQMVEAGDPELRPQALLSLGAMKNPTALPTLLRLAQEADPWVKKPEIKKEAIRALGEIGSPAAVPALGEILRRRKLWRRARYDEVRAAAAIALGDIGGQEAATALQAACDDRSEAVARAAVSALKQFGKGGIHESGTP